jgi:cobalamin biosynthesis Co2+ chelatase CbiK
MYESLELNKIIESYKPKEDIDFLTPIFNSNYKEYDLLQTLTVRKIIEKLSDKISDDIVNKMLTK